VAEQRRALAAAAREKKAAKARSAALTPYEPGEAADDGRVGDEKLSNREVIEWVWEHLGEVRCPKAPNRKARELWRYAKRNRDGFLDKYVPMLLKGEKADTDEEQERKRDRSYVACMDRLERFLAETTNVVPAGPQGSAGQ
jgi:hypothetical protein